MTGQLLSSLIILIAMALAMASQIKNIHKWYVLKKGKLPIVWKKVSSQAAKKQLGKSIRLAFIGFVLLSIANVGGIVFRHELGAAGVAIGLVMTFVILIFFMRKFIIEMTKSTQQALALMLPTGEELLEIDKRKPILYLRSFKDDREAGDSAKLPILHSLTPPDSPDEVDLCQLLFTYGPVVAVGKPSEQLPPLGASRLYFGDTWQEEVIKLMNSAQIIALRLGESSGIKWELQQAFNQNVFEKLLLIFPPRIDTNEKNSLYKYLRNIISSLSGVNIVDWPVDIGDIAVLSISNEKKPIPFNSKGFFGMNAWQLSLRQATDKISENAKLP